MLAQTFSRATVSLVPRAALVRYFVYLCRLFLTWFRFPGGVAEYNKTVDKELRSIEEALDAVADNVDDIDYSISVDICEWSSSRTEFFLSI